MSWKLIDRPKTSRVTRAIATEFATMDPAPHDRPLSERRLVVYQRLLKSGSFRPVTWAKATCVETNSTYRVNGKHTSVMLSGLETIPEFYVTIESYECDTLDDVARLYSTFDSSIQSRSANDIYLSFAGTITELKGVRSRTITNAASGMAMSTWQMTYNTQHQPAERAELLLDHPDFVLWLDSIYHTGEEGGRSLTEAKHIHRVAVAAAMFDSWRKSQDDATTFWLAVRDETGTNPNNPDRVLAKFLSVSSVNTGNGSRVRRDFRRADPREIYVKCLHAWNAWRKGDTTRLNYHIDSEIPSAK